MKKSNAQKNSLNDAIEALDEIVKTKGIDKEDILVAFETALIAACKKDHKGVNNVRAEIDRETQEIELAIQKTVVEEVEDPANEISLDEAKKLSLAYEPGDVVEFPVDPLSLGRVATQNAKQYVLQQIKESERKIIFDTFSEKKDELMVGIVQRTDKGNVYVDLGKSEGIMNYQNQVPGEEYLYGMRIKVYISDVVRTSKGSQIFVSRANPNLIKRLFEVEIPEIFDGTVEIKSISREAGSRTKIAVYAQNANVDAVGACVGQRGIRIQNILNEIGNEKIDVIEYSEDPAIYIKNAISPAETLDVLIDEEQHMAVLIVDEGQLSLAIGKDGQNVRLAARLTGWKIDIKTPAQYEEMLNDENLSTKSEIAGDVEFENSELEVKQECDENVALESENENIESTEVEEVCE